MKISRHHRIVSLVVLEVVEAPQEVPEVAVLGVLDDDVEGPVLRADAEQVDDVDDVVVAADHLHHVHLGDEVDHLLVGVALLQHLHRHSRRLAAVHDVHGLGADDLKIIESANILSSCLLPQISYDR